MEKITLREGDYVLTEGLSDDVCKAIADNFVGAGAKHCELNYGDLGELLGWDVRDDLLYTSSNGYYYRTDVFTGRCLTPEQVLGTVTQEWSGKGLPPVGEVCEVNYCESWQVCEIIAHFQQKARKVAAFTVERSDGAKSLDAFAEWCFRPIKTDEERDVEAIMDILQGNIFDRGWSLEDTAKEIYNYLQNNS